MTTLYVRDTSGFREAEPSDVFDRARALLAQRFRAGSPVLSSPALTHEFLRMHLGDRDHEIFGLIHLDGRYRLVAVEDLFRGTIDRASVHPRDVLKSVLAHNSAAVVLFHNHPNTGHSAPSEADLQITQRIREVLALVDCKVVDHLILADPIYSFAQSGLL